MGGHGLLGGRDLFELWRLLLCTVCMIYAGVVTLRSLLRWDNYLSGPDRKVSLLRNYVVVQVLRLRFRRFAWEFVQTGLWLLVLVVLLYEH